MRNRFVETWKVNNHINIALLDCVDEQYFNELNATKRLKLSDEFIHIHNARVLWLKENRSISFSEIQKINNPKLAKEVLRDALVESGEAMALLIEQSLSEGKMNGFKTPIEFVNYIVSYESQNRNKIVMMLAFSN